MSEHDLLRMDVPCDETAPGLVRAQLDSGQLDEVEPYDFRLIVSELVNNAVVHSGCEGDHAIHVQISRLRDHIRVSVTDPGISSGTARVLGPAHSGFGGMGVWLVDQLTRRWGTDRNDGYRVWAELPLG